MDLTLISDVYDCITDFLHYFNSFRFKEFPSVLKWYYVTNKLILIAFLNLHILDQDFHITLQ